MPKSILQELLKCPVVDTVSTSSKGLKKLIEEAIKVIGKEQVSVYKALDINVSTKENAELSDRHRFEFVNEIVKQVEVRHTFTNKTKPYFIKKNSIFTEI